MRDLRENYTIFAIFLLIQNYSKIKFIKRKNPHEVGSVTPIYREQQLREITLPIASQLRARCIPVDPWNNLNRIACDLLYLLLEPPCGILWAPQPGDSWEGLGLALLQLSFPNPRAVFYIY